MSRFKGWLGLKILNMLELLPCTIGGVLPIVLFLAGVVALVVAMVAVGCAVRGRRIDDHPLCRVCGFDLTGKPEGSGRCSECGGDVTGAGAVVIGHRVVRWGWAWGVAPVVALALVVVVGMGTLISRPADANRYKPAWWLGKEATSGNLIWSWSALRELRSRIAAGADLRSSLEGTVDRLLAIQADPQAYWEYEWGDLIIAQYQGRFEDDPRWRRFLQQSTIAKLRVRDEIERGDLLPVEVRLLRRSGTIPLNPEREIRFSFLVNGIPVESEPDTPSILWSGPVGFWSYHALDLSDVGKVELEGRLSLKVEVLSVLVAASEPKVAVTEAVKREGAIVSRSVWDVSVRVLDPGTLAPDAGEGLNDPKSRAIVRYFVQAVSGAADGPRINLYATVSPPQLLAYEIYWLVDEKPVFSGETLVVARDQSGFLSKVPLPPGKSAEEAVLLVVPSAAVAKASIHSGPFAGQVVRLQPTSDPNRVPGDPFGFEVKLVAAQP